MNSSATPARVSLKPLIIYCCPESGLFLPIESSDFPAFFAVPDIAVSFSAQNKGWARNLAADFKVFTANDESSLLLRLNTYDLVLVHPLSLNSLAKFALGIQDSLPSRLFFEATRLGKPVLLNDHFLPAINDQMNPHLVRTYRKHWEGLLSGTVSGFNLENLESTSVKILRNRTAVAVKTGERQIITREDVTIAAESLEPFKVPVGAIITDLAREEAEKRGVIFLTD
ncbi:MAG: flavoprotein [Candidatus Rifleibacteriota bacterium]